MGYSQKVYDQLADSYQDVSKERKNYLFGVDKIILPQIKNRHSMLDLGSGDGIRALRIKENAKIDELTFVENSHEMVKKCRELEAGTVIEDNIQDFQSDKTFDVATCLWNVLGNVETYQDRVKVLKNVRKKLTSTGVFFFDVLNRYNISYYGLFAFAKTFISDLDGNGNNRNKIYTKMAGSHKVTYNVHYFSEGEVRQMIDDADLELLETYYVDYKSGEQVDHSWQGQLLYKVGLRTKK